MLPQNVSQQSSDSHLCPFKKVQKKPTMKQLSYTKINIKKYEISQDVKYDASFKYFRKSAKKQGSKY